jgi:putative glutamine amidotransferase
VVSRPLVAVVGRRLGETARWPYSHASALPQRYLEAVRRGGGEPVVVDPNGADVATVVDRADALVLTGGPDLDPAVYGERPHLKTYGVDAAADAFELALARVALERALPTLAICRGLQIVNVAFGGTLYQHLPEEPGVEPHGRPGEAGGETRQEIDVDGDSLLASVMGATRVVGSCHHHQGVAKVAECLRVTARACDGIVEGIEHDDAWLLAVQWHPEDTAADDPAQQRLFDALVRRTSNWRG